MPVLARTANGNVALPAHYRHESVDNNGRPLSKRQRAKALNDELFHQRSFHVSSSTTGGRHVERIAPRGQATAEWFACVHTPVPIPKALKIPAAREALEKEWKKLENKSAWDLGSVRERAAVIKEATSKGTTVHFGDLM